MLYMALPSTVRLRRTLSCSMMSWIDLIKDFDNRFDLTKGRGGGKVILIGSLLLASGKGNKEESAFIKLILLNLRGPGDP